MTDRSHEASVSLPAPAAEPAGWIGRLRAAWRGWRTAVPARLAIGGLPDALAGLDGSGVYALYAAPSAACDAVLFETARLARRPVTLALARPAAALLEALAARGFVARGSVAQGSVADKQGRAAGWPARLDVLSIVPRAAQASPAPLARLRGALAGLARAGIARHALLILEGAADWFSWEDAAALAREGQALAAWCAARHCAVLLVLPAQAGSDAGAHGLQGSLSGAAHLFELQGEVRWQVAFWRWRDGLVSGETLPLRFTGAHALTVAPARAVSQADAALLAPDEARVVVSALALEAQQWTPPGWEIVPDNAGVLHACAGARGATAVLDYGGHRELEALAGTIHGLRRMGGPALKIVVRERGEGMRQQYELLCLRLGANLVISRETPFSKLLSLLQSVQGQVTTRALDEDFHAALAGALNDAPGGYLPVPRFCAHVADAVERGRVLSLPHVLVVFRLEAHVAHLDVLRTCTLQRSGDACTADRDHVYLFLFSCRMSDVQQVLARVFRTPLETMFRDEMRMGDPDSYLAAVRQLAEHERTAPAPDYGDALARNQSPAAVPATSINSEAAPAVVTPAVPASLAVPPHRSAVSVTGAAWSASACSLPVRPSARSQTEAPDASRTATSH